MITTEIDYLILVNKDNKLPDDWKNIVELDSTKDAWDEEIQVESGTLKKFYELKKYFEKENIYIEIDSSYRSIEEQQRIWNEYEKEFGINYTKRFVAVPGYSEHHTGLAIDICLRKGNKIIGENKDLMNEEKSFLKIHKKLADYGFILRYPNGKESITGYGYEPWHIRYIKDIKTAKYIMDNNLTLEEYLERKI